MLLLQTPAWLLMHPSAWLHDILFIPPPGGHFGQKKKNQQAVTSTELNHLPILRLMLKLYVLICGFFRQLRQQSMSSPNVLPVMNLITDIKPVKHYLLFSVFYLLEQTEDLLKTTGCLFLNDADPLLGLFR